jgi:hypothetical protein
VAQRRKQKHPSTRDNSTHSTPATLADSDPELPIDKALALFLRRPPSSADHWVATAFTSQGEIVIQDRTITETRSAAVELANETSEAARKWAESEGKELRFRCTWQASERVLASHQWRAGEGDPTSLDGTVDSFLAQQQRHLETVMRMRQEDASMIQEGWSKLLQSSQRRIDALEKTVGELQDRLRKAGDVDAEVTMAQVAADIESRSRTTEILENRLGPIVQHLLARSLVAPAPAAAASGNPDKTDENHKPASAA